MAERPRPPLEEIYGTLPDWVIKELIEKKIVKIEPQESNWKEAVGTMTIDLRLGERILIPKHEPHTYIDVRKEIYESLYDVINLKKDQPHIMKPGQFIIAPTLERLTLPDDIVGRLEGRSSLARIGIVVHLSSGRFDPGWDGNPILELKNNSDIDIIIYGGMPVCAFSFERLMAPVENPYKKRGRYLGDGIHSLIHKDNQKGEEQK